MDMGTALGRFLLALVGLATLGSSAFARTWHIVNDGSGDAPTVQAGIDSAAVGDTVLVGPGTYLENLSIVGKDLVLESQMGPEGTILDGGGILEAAVFISARTRATQVLGFTITGGRGHLRGSGHDGGGVYLEEASPEIRGNIIRMNTARYGGGLYSISPSRAAAPLIEQNRFEDNNAILGAGLLVGDGTAEIRNNAFRSNICSLDGGAIYAVFNSGSVTIEGNQFWDNYAGDHGGAVHIGGTEASQVRVVWNLFVRNTAEGSAGDYGAGGAIRVARVSGLIANNTLVDNAGPNWTSCGGGGLSLEDTPPGLEIYGNVIARNRSCGLTCVATPFEPQNILGLNLFWANSGGDLGQGGGGCPFEWADNQIFADPLFCGPEVGNYTVAINSPALTGQLPMGVWTSPGCGPGVPVRPTTWGRLKARYGSGDS